MDATIQANRARYIAHALSLYLAPGQVSELRVLGVQGRRAICQFFTNPSDMAVAALGYEAQGATGVYFTPNPLSPGLLERLGDSKGAAKADVLSRRWLLIDVDAVRPVGQSATDGEKAAARDVARRVLEQLSAAEIGGEILSDSGNGWHIAVPVDMPNDDASQDFCKSVLANLSRLCSSTQAVVDAKTFDAPRIWKMPGLLTRKGEATEDRPHRASKVEHVRAPWSPEMARSNVEAIHCLLEKWQQTEQLYQGLEQFDALYRCSTNGSSSKPEHNDIVGRAKAYLRKMPPAVAGAGGHNQAFHAAMVIVEGFGLQSWPDFEAAITEWNATCTPPWSEEELRHKHDSALKRADPVRTGHLLHGDAWEGPEPARTKPASSSRSEKAAEKEQEKAAARAAWTIDDVCTIADLVAAGAKLEWLWPGWIQLGVLTAIAAVGGAGKTRFCADLLRRIAHGLPWPDGSPMTLEPDARVLWVVSDNNHDELVTVAKTFDIERHIFVSSHKSEPYEGTSLETLIDLAEFERRVELVRPAFFVVDTVGNSCDKNLSVQEDAKAYYTPLQRIARKHRCAGLCLTHLSASGGALGRRIIEKVRTAIFLSQPDEQDDRRKMWVGKSNSVKPEALGVTMGTEGNEYDHDPPKGPDDHGATKGIPAKVLECAEWLKNFLKFGKQRVSHTRKQAEANGFSTGTLYRAKEAAHVQETDSEGYKWWALTEPKCKEDGEAL